MFALAPRLAQDTLNLGHFPLSLLLMAKDANYPWFILVPRRVQVREIHHLDSPDRQQLLWESCHLAETLEALYRPDKLNVAAIGNLVPQLHLHHVVRFENDPAWPAPVWGKMPAADYPPGEMRAAARRLTSRLEHFTPAG